MQTARPRTVGAAAALIAIIVAGVVGLVASPAAAATTATVTMPTALPVNTGFQDVTVQVTNSGGPSYDAIRLSLAIDGPPFLGSDDLFVEVENPSLPGSYFGVPLTPGAQSGDFTVAAVGVDVALPANTSTTFNLRVATGPGAPAGSLTFSATVRQVNSGTPGSVIATGSDTTELLSPQVTVGSPPAIAALGTGDLTATLDNGTGAPYEDVEGRFALVGGADLTPDDITVSVNTGGGFVPVSLGQPAATKVEGTFALPGDVLPEGTTTVTIRIVRKVTSTAGNYRTEVSVQTKFDDAGLGFGAGTATFTGGPTLAFPSPASLAPGGVAQSFAVTVANPSSSAYSDLRIVVEITGPSGIVASDILLAYIRPGTTTPVRMNLIPSAGKLVGRIPAGSGVDLAAGASAVYAFSVRGLPGIPTGASSVTAKLVVGDGTDALTSVVRPLTISGTPTVSVNAPATAPRGGATRDIGLTFTGVAGVTIDPARIDLRFTGPAGFGPEDIALTLDNPATVPVDHTPVSLVSDAGGVRARLPQSTGTALTGATARTYALRLTTLVSAPLGALNLTATVIATNAEGSFVTAEPLATGTDAMTITSVTGATSTALVASPNPGRATQAQTLTATVTTSDPDAPSWSGTVTFRDGTTSLGTVNVNAAGQASLVLTEGLPTGDRKLTATYSGSGALQGSASPQLNLLVTPPTLLGRYVDAVYRKILLRPAEPAGLAYWEGRLNNGLSRRGYADTLFRLSEPLTRVCDSFYLELLDRKGTATERSTCVTRLKNKELFPVLRSEIAGSNEFLASAGGTNAAFLAELYTRVLRRDVTPSESAFWLARLGAGTTRRAIAFSVLTSAERYGLTVDDAYLSMLGRLSDAPGRQYWVDRMRGGLSETVLLANLLGSPEYLSRVP